MIGIMKDELLFLREIDFTRMLRLFGSAFINPVTKQQKKI